MQTHSIFSDLFDVIEDRKSKLPSESYVASLFEKGIPKMNEKIIEEAGEVCEAANETENTHLVYEICDLIFHAFVLAGYKGIRIEDIESELKRRFGKSGLTEKAERNK